MEVFNHYCNITQQSPVVRSGMVEVIGFVVGEKQVGKWVNTVVRDRKQKFNKHGNPVATRIKSRKVNHFRDKQVSKLVKRLASKGQASVNKMNRDQVEAANLLLQRGEAVIVNERKRTVLIEAVMA